MDDVAHAFVVADQLGLRINAGALQVGLGVKVMHLACACVAEDAVVSSACRSSRCRLSGSPLVNGSECSVAW
jgi:hypothetical protein